MKFIRILLIYISMAMLTLVISISLVMTSFNRAYMEHPYIFEKVEGFLAQLEYFIKLQIVSFPYFLIYLAIAILISLAFTAIFPKTVHLNCKFSTTAISIALSWLTAATTYCGFLWFVISIFHDADVHPIEYRTSVAGILVGSMMIFLLLIAYAFYRKRNLNVKGIIIDIFTFVLYLPAFFCHVSLIRDALSFLV